MLNILARFRDDECGATAVEYGLIVALLVIAMSVGMNGFAGATIDMWTYVSDSVDTAIK